MLTKFFILVIVFIILGSVTFCLEQFNNGMGTGMGGCNMEPQLTCNPTDTQGKCDWINGACVSVDTGSGGGGMGTGMGGGGMGGGGLGGGGIGGGGMGGGGMGGGGFGGGGFGGGGTGGGVGRIAGGFADPLFDRILQLFP